MTPRLPLCPYPSNSNLRRHGPGTQDCSLRALLSAGCDPNIQDNEGHTPLHYVLTDELHSNALQRADQINHFKQATARAKINPRCSCRQRFCQATAADGKLGGGCVPR